MFFFYVDYYYLYPILNYGGRQEGKVEAERGPQYIEPITGMNLIYTVRIIGCHEDGIRPLSPLLWKFMKIGPCHHGTSREGMMIAYEMFDNIPHDPIDSLHPRILNRN